MATLTLLETSLVILLLFSTRIETSELTIGVILPFDVTYPWSVRRVLPGIEIAVQTVRQRGILPDHLISINTLDSQCSETHGPLAAIEVHKHDRANVFFGPVCDYALAPVARFTPHWNIPLISAGGQVSAFDNKDTYKLLTRINGAYSNAALSFLAVAQEFNWTQFGLIYHDNKFDRSTGKFSCYFKMETLFIEMSKVFYPKPWFSSFDENRPGSYNFTQILKDASEHARILVVCASDDSLREMMIAAHDLQLDGGQYVFINFDVFGSKVLNTKTWFRATDTAIRNEKARSAYQALLTLRTRQPSSPQYSSFSREVKRRAMEKYSDVNFEEEAVNSFVGAYHDAVILYALALNETLGDGFSVSDGEEITKCMWNKTFEGVTGVVNIDANGDRISDYTLLDMDTQSGEFQVVGKYFGSLMHYEPVVGRHIHWAGPSERPPPDTPTCGFDQAICPPAEEPIEPMLPPSDLKAIVLSGNAIVVTWTDPSLGKTQSHIDNRYYTVQYNSIPPSWEGYKSINTTDMVCHIDDLKPYTQYLFSVKVSKGKRKSTWSMSVENTTQEAVPGSMPQNVTPVAVDTNPLAVTLTWKHPQKPNGQITGYLVFYTTDPGKGDVDWVVEGVIGEKLSITITQLMEDTTYYFKVQARNRKGYGPISNTVVYKTPTRKMETKPVFIGPHPENATVILGGVASFQCKVETVVHQPNIQWLKRLKSEDILNKSAVIDLKGEKFSVLKTGEVWKDAEGFYLKMLIIRNTMPSDAGMYICLSENSMGYSYKSAFLTVRSIPSHAPRDVTITSCSSLSMSAELRWEPGYNGKPETTGYLVQFNTSEDPLTWNSATETLGSVKSAKVDLYPWAEFRFRVLAKNNFGYSKPSLPTAERCVLPPGRPLQNPRDVAALTHEKGKLIITWTPVPRQLQGGPYFRYMIAWRRPGITNQFDWNRYEITDPAASKFETRVSGTYRLFEINVEAANAFGRSPQEAPILLGRSGEAEPLVVPRGLRLDVTKPAEHGRTHFVWTAVDTSPEAIQGEFRGYELRCESGDGVVYTSVVSKDELDRQQRNVEGMILGLPPGTDIQAKVAVKNRFYIGPYSDILTFRTTGDPGAKTNKGDVTENATTSTKNATTSTTTGAGVVEITNITASSKTIFLAWKISSHLPGLSVSKYRIDCRHYVDGRWVTMDGCRHFTTKKRHITFSNLIPASLYKVRVKAKSKRNKKKVISNWHKVNTTSLKDTGAKASHPIRLPETVRPLHYKLTFDPKIYGKGESDFSSEGTAEITINCIQRTNKIFLHSKDLNWTKVELRTHKQKKINVIQIDTLSDVEIVEIRTGKPMKVNKTYQLSIEFTGRITDILQGFYYSPYKENNSTKYIFTTLMQPTDARRVFPSFDEPDFKATFQINIVRHESLKTTSNAVLDSTESREDGYLMDVYADTPKMSTYLVAFVIGDFDYMETAAGTTQLRTWARPSILQHTKFALDIGAKLFKFYENYFQIKYPMDKIDLVAVPTMIFNGMEHWGMVTIRETAMLYEEGVSSEAQLDWTALLLAHELSHQWFGNLVSPRWWDNLWLNEGFATYMMFLGLDAVLPGWKMMNKLPLDYRGVQNVMSIDDSLTSHPVYIPVSHPDEINEIFDLVSYAKGCAVIRMLHFFLGNDTFVKGLHGYLNEYSFSTATQDDLWRVLGKQAEDDGIAVSDVKSVMDSWLLEENYPVVTVSRDTPTTIALTQTAFLLDESERRNRSEVYWEIPFVYTHQNELNFNKTTADIIWLHEDGAKVHVVDKSLQYSKWIIGNVQQLGFYRVNYDQENWRLIVCQLKKDHFAIHPVNRAQIINDAWNLARSGMLDFHIALSTLDYLQQEEDFVPWKAAFRILDYLDRSLHLSPMYGKFKSHMRKKLEHVYNKSVPKDSHYDKMHHSAVMAQTCKYGLETCTATALIEFDNWLLNSSYRVDPDLKIAVYSVGVRTKGGAAWNKMFQRFSKTRSPSDRAVFIQALSNTNEPWIITRFLQMSLSSDVFSNTEKVDVIDYLSSNPIGRLLTWDFVVENWNTYFERYGSGTNLFAKLVKGLTKCYNTKAELQRVEAFANEHKDLGTATREFQKSLAKIKFNVHWMENNYKLIGNWLSDQLEYGSITDDYCHE